ncbi:hypothetical protein [Actinoplanes sp. NPDC051411]|uniref:hypothetical protein n=1 Tax=Actinoplanes sp. NPDC051411 TaxID=3155522 RepID=UPI00343A1C35
MLAWSGLSALTPLTARWLSARMTPRTQLLAGLRYVGSAIDLAVVSITVTRGGHDPAAVLHGWSVAVLLTSAFSLLGALVVLLTRQRATAAEPVHARVWAA